jgi:hypothetical protein
MSDEKFDFSDLRVRRALVRFTETGAKSNCPFCMGRMITSVSPGERIIILEGMYAGRCATVSNQPPWSDHEFLVQFDAEKRGTLTRIIYGLNKFAYLPLKPIPEWLCHLSVDDLSLIDQSCLDTALSFATANANSSLADLLLPVLSTIRQRRLPVSSTEIWSTLVAQGFPRNRKQKFKEYFDFGLRLLLLFNGRPSVQRKRMKPMSRGRYLTAGHEEWSGPSPRLTS